jgi:hypothetical protein
MKNLKFVLSAMVAALLISFSVPLAFAEPIMVAYGNPAMVTLPKIYDPLPASSRTEVHSGSTVLRFNRGGQGVALLMPAKITWEFRGKEAGYHNRFRANKQVLSNRQQAGAKIVTQHPAGVVNFAFSSSTHTGNVELVNGKGTSSSTMSFTMARVGDNRYILTFADPGTNIEGRQDYDDMVVMATVVPVVPAPELCRQ